MHELDVNVEGLRVHRGDVADALRGKVWSWQTCCSIGNGKLAKHAWIKTGFATMAYRWLYLFNSPHAYADEIEQVQVTIT